MDTYTTTAYRQSKILTAAYSTSFTMSMQLFHRSLRRHIYAIYGLVRLADEIVDTYNGNDREELLNAFEAETVEAIDRGYSTNPIIHSYAITAAHFKIPVSLLTSFFESMRMDITPTSYSSEEYSHYIYGSAEVVGLMCLRVFTNDNTLYDELSNGAQSLGAGYQKINFLRDIQADSVNLNRWYFPFSSYESFSEEDKQHIIDDITVDFTNAAIAIRKLPRNS